MFCPTCGKQIENNIKYCEDCGHCFSENILNASDEVANIDTEMPCATEEDTVKTIDALSGEKTTAIDTENVALPEESINQDTTCVEQGNNEVLATEEDINISHTNDECAMQDEKEPTLGGETTPIVTAEVCVEEKPTIDDKNAALSQEAPSNEMDAIDAFLAVMDEMANRNSEAGNTDIRSDMQPVYQKDEERLFLDDEEETKTPDEHLISQFFDNLDTIGTDEELELTSEYIPVIEVEKKITPVLEEIPPEFPTETENSKEFSNSAHFDDDDDYSDIVIGGTISSAPPAQPTAVIPVATPVEESEDEYSTLVIENDVPSPLVAEAEENPQEDTSENVPSEINEAGTESTVDDEQQAESKEDIADATITEEAPLNASETTTEEMDAAASIEEMFVDAIGDFENPTTEPLDTEAHNAEVNLATITNGDNVLSDESDNVVRVDIDMPAQNTSDTSSASESYSVPVANDSPTVEIEMPEELATADAEASTLQEQEEKAIPPVLLANETEAFSPVVLDNGACLLIDEQPIDENKSKTDADHFDIDINLDEAASTPYLDSFFVGKNLNIEIEQPEVIEEKQNVITLEIEDLSTADSENEPQNNEAVTENADVELNNSDSSISNDIPSEDVSEEAIEVEKENKENEEEAPAANTNDSGTVEESVSAEPFTVASNNVATAIETSNVDASAAHSNANKKNKILLLSAIALLSICLILSCLLLPNMKKQAETPPENTIPNVVQNSNPNWEIKETSSLTEPLTVGEATSVSKFLTDTKDYANVQVKLSDIIRGAEASALAKKYEEQNSIKFEATKENTEYVVIEYYVYIPAGIKTEGTTANLPIKIRGLTTEYVLHDKSAYNIATWCLDDAENSQAGSLVVCRDIFQLPIECDDYYIVFGTKDHTTATYRGE